MTYYTRLRQRKTIAALLVINIDAHQQHRFGLFSVDVAPPCGHSNFWPSAATVFKRVHVCLLATAHLIKSCIKMRISDPLMYLVSQCRYFSGSVPNISAIIPGFRF